MSTQGDGMAEVTEGDREKAEAVADAAEYRGRKVLENAIAAALAHEREKVRAPFLALAEEWEEDVVGAGWDEHANGKAEAAADIRRAAEVTE